MTEFGEDLSPAKAEKEKPNCEPWQKQVKEQWEDLYSISDIIWKEKHLIPTPNPSALT